VLVVTRRRRRRRHRRRRRIFEGLDTENLPVAVDTP